MRWTVLRGNSQILAVHAALVVTAGKTGQILYFSGDEHDQGQHNRGLIDHARLFNCVSSVITNPGSPPRTDLFCCGHSFLADGQLLTAGGTRAFANEVPGPHHPHFPGLRDAWRFDPATLTWNRVALMNPEPGRTVGGGRWYPMLVTLANGHILAMSGHPLEDDSRHTNNSPEIYSPVSNTWTLATPSDPAHEMEYYPRLHVLPNGEVFCATPLSSGRNQRFNPNLGTWTDVCQRPSDNIYWGFATTSILLPLRPSDNYRPRVLLCGGQQPQLLDLGAATPGWTPTSARKLNAPNSPRRRNLNAVILPTGEVFICGGVSADNNADTSRVLEAELYNPATNTWTTLPAAAATRNYHSVALLMPDGRVWTAGGNVNAQQSFPAPGVDNRELRIEIFEPWYHGRTDRPHITALPDTIHSMQDFLVRSGAGETISQVVLIRAGSCTHAFDPDQRYVELAFTRRGGNRLNVKAPPNNNIAPPGNYLLFLINSASIPSEGKFINLRITPAPLLNRVGDFDGDGQDEILVSSPWGIGILKQTGATMSPLMMAPNGTRFGEWLLNTADNTFEEVADYDGDGRDEILVTSPWGIGILKLSGGTLTASMMAPNGTRFGGWLLNTADNHFELAADFDGDGQDEVLVSSPWGIGILKQAGATMAAPMMAPNGTRFGEWLLNTADNDFGPAGDYDGDGRAEILIKSPWGIGILKHSGITMSAPMMQPNGTRFGGWLLNTADNYFGPSGDYDGDGRAEILVSSPWGIGILKQAGTTMSPLMMAPNGTRFGGWLLNTVDNDFGPAGDYDGDGRPEIFVESPWGIGILKLSGGALTAPMMKPNGTRFGGWLLNTVDNRFGSVGKYGGGRVASIFVTSPWGIGILKQAGDTMAAPMMAPNGTRFGGWLLNTADNVF